MTLKKITATIEAALTAANGSRRDRLADEWEVRAAVNDALKTGVGHKMAATVPAAYRYSAHRTAVAAVAVGDLVAVYVSTISANRGTSDVSWFSGSTILRLEKWYDALTYDTWPLDRARIVMTRRQARAWHRASMERAYGPLPTRTEAQALRAARLAQVTV
jgi:hypothetical protein